MWKYLIKDNGLYYHTLEADTIIEMLELYYKEECSWHPVTQEVFSRLVNAYKPIAESDEVVEAANQLFDNSEKILSIEIISKTLWEDTSK